MISIILPLNLKLYNNGEFNDGYNWIRSIHNNEPFESGIVDHFQESDVHPNADSEIINSEYNMFLFIIFHN